ncbi:MAG TPA: RDD family protein, partial [Dyella sp.]|uniref:RDD family protein n=1 Tax=Dyella sp. TaxID=1869338 RepID=UPI002F93652D
ALTWWFQPLQYVVISAYFAGSWLRGGQTLGMRPWRIRLRSANGAPVAWRQAAVRLVVAWLPIFALELQGWTGTRIAVYVSLGCWAIWFAVALVDGRKRALHDMLAGTELRRIPS